jgi:hypothetical protein
MDSLKVGLGALLLVVSSVILLAIGTIGSSIPVYLGAIAALGLAAGSLLVGTSSDGQPV